jgi:hypothetical protein
MMRFAVLATVVAGCASGSTNGAQSDAPGGGGPPDTSGQRDAPIVVTDAPADAAHHADAFVQHDAPQDAFVPDAPPDACVPATTELLTNHNPSFDATPLGTGWTEGQYMGVEQVTNDYVQSAPYSLFLGGWVGYGTVTDQIYQDVAIPAGTTSLVLTGYVAVGTMETTTTTAYDTAQAGLVHPSDSSPIETALSVSNLTNTGGGYTAFSHSFAVTGLSGTTVRLRLTSTSDDTNNTNFFFDTLSFHATHCP